MEFLCLEWTTPPPPVQKSHIQSDLIRVARLSVFSPFSNVYFHLCGVHVHMLNHHLAAVKRSSQHWSWDVNTHSHGVLFLAKLQRQTFTKLCCMSRICTSQERFNSVCGNVSKCTRAGTWTYTSQDFLSYKRNGAALSSQNNATISILCAARYNLFQSTCLAVRIPAKQPTIASSVYYHQKGRLPREETHPTLLIPCFHTSSVSLRLIKTERQ